MPYCNSCGEAVDQNDSFCRSCGTEQSSETRKPDQNSEDAGRYAELSNKELLEEVAELDPDTYPIAEDARNALEHWED